MKLSLGAIILPMGFPGGASGEEPDCQCRRYKRRRFHPGSGRSPGGGRGNALQYSCLEDPMDRGVWWTRVLGMAKSWTLLKWLSTHTVCLYLPIHNVVYVHWCLFSVIRSCSWRIRLTQCVLFSSQGLNPGRSHFRKILYWLSYQGSPLSLQHDHKLSNVNIYFC